MKVSRKTITALGRIVTGDEGLSPYRSGPALVCLFNDYGADDEYGQGFPSRWSYAESKLRELNDKPALGSLLCEVLDPRDFMDTDFNVENALDYINKRLKFDGFEVHLDRGLPKIRDLDGAQVDCKHPFEGSIEDGHLFIEEQIEKCGNKIEQGDFDGAITNARSLVEAVLMELERQLDPSPKKYDGNLPKLFKRVQKQLNLDPSRPDIETPLKQVLSGLNSVIIGMSGISNRMGDRHARTYRPSKHHSLLVVNSAKTLANFLFATHKHQVGKGHISTSDQGKE